MRSAALQALLEEAYRTHSRVSGIAEFCDFPTDLQENDFVPRMLPSGELMVSDPAMNDPHADPLAHAIIGAANDVRWLANYEDTDIGSDFLERFGNYCVIGENGPWRSKKISAWVVYMPPGMYYPWHHHLAEEVYYVLAGGATFMREDLAPETLSQGQMMFHAKNQPHAAETHDRGMMAYVLWRNHLEGGVELTDRQVASG